tara:strand:+ start:1252 stop:1803 length:552 start_codon:yes stop_codon:yes gene_type:complete
MKKINLVIFSGSNKPSSFEEIKIDLEKIARNLKKDKYSVWYGGGETGLMGIIPYNFHLKGGEVFSVDAKQFVEIYGSASFGKTYVMDTFNERQQGLLNSGDIFLCLPGGIGTLSELFDVLVNIDVNKKDFKIILYSYNNFYKNIIEFLEDKKREGFIKSRVLENIIIYDNSKDIIDFFDKYPV